MRFLQTFIIGCWLLSVGTAHALPSWSSVTTASGNASSCSFSVTVSGSNTLLVATIHIAAGGGVGTASSATYAGQALTFIDGQNDPSGTARIEMWYRHAPTAGANTFTANFSATQLFYCAVHVLTNAHQSAALGASAKNSATDNAPTVTVSSDASQLVIDALTGVNGSGYTCTPGSGQTERYDSTASGDLTCGSTEPGAGSVVMSHSFSPSDSFFWTMMAASFKEAAGAARRRASPIVFP